MTNSDIWEHGQLKNRNVALYDIVPKNHLEIECPCGVTLLKFLVDINRVNVLILAWLDYLTDALTTYIEKRNGEKNNGKN